MRTLAELAGGDPLVLIFSRGWWCPKEQRYLRALTGLQDELEVAFLSDAQRDWLPRLGLLETTDTLHRPYRPAGFTLFPDLTIHGAYNGYWYWGRATMEELRQDMRAISRALRPDWVVSAARARRRSRSPTWCSTASA